jgi:hypothetical protein
MAAYPAEPSPFTSWTPNYWLARQPAQDGVVLQIENEDSTRYKWVASPDNFDEAKLTSGAK